MKKYILVNIILLAIFVYVLSLYYHRKAIINCESPINTFSVLEVNCSSGYRGGSNILIEFNTKQYYVGITTRQCKSFNPREIKLYYDKAKDEVFEQNELTIRYVVLYFILYLCSCVWLFVIVKNQKSSNR